MCRGCCAGLGILGCGFSGEIRRFGRRRYGVEDLKTFLAENIIGLLEGLRLLKGDVIGC